MSLSRYIFKRITFFIITLFITITINFLLPRLMPGNPVDYFLRDPSITPEERALLIQQFGLDKDVFTQYILYIKNLFTGNLGVSFRYYPRPVTEVLLSRLPWTLYLLGISYSLATVIGIILGAYAAWKKESKVDLLTIGIAFITRSMPIFWLGMLTLYIFSVHLGWFPLSGAVTAGAEYSSFLDFALDVLRHSILPMIVITIFLLGPPALITRGLVLDSLTEPYVDTAIAKGLPPRVILFKHALRPVSLPLSSYTAILLGYVVGGAVFTETVFSWPGVGRLIYEAIMRRDYPLIQGAFLLISISVLIANFIVDFIYAYLDPRVRLR